MPAIDFQGNLVEGGAGFVAGGGQRMAWEASETIGLIATGGSILGGIVVQAFSNNPLLRSIGRAVTISGASVGGWVAAEKFMIEGSADRRIGHLPGQVQNERGMFDRSNGVVAHRAMVPLDDDVTVL